MKSVAVLNAHDRLGLSAGDYPWHHFIVRSGEAGERWFQEFEANNGSELTTSIDHALAHLRRRRLQEGRVLLEASYERIEAMRKSASAPVICALERYYHSAKAYERYLDEDFEGAEHEFKVAVRAIREAIEELPCLVSLAYHCYDFRLQRARIARNQARWRLMRNHIEAGRDMVESRRPLCVLENGQAIYVETADAFHRNIEPRDIDEGSALKRLLDIERRRRMFERTAQENYALPGIVIPYRPARNAT